MKTTSARQALSSLAVLTALPLAVASYGCSGESSGGATGGSGGASATGGNGSGGKAEECLSSFGPIDPTALIDDLEDGNPSITTTASRNGSWWVVSDGTAGTIAPPADQAPLPERIPGGRCGSNYAMRLTGQGFTDWGAVLTAGFRYTSQAEPIDASAFRGVMFWARIGDTSGSGLRVQFQDSNTRPEGGQCTDMSGSPDECYNGFGTAIAPLGTSWQLYKLEFSRMAQRDFGHRADALDTAHLYNIEWGLESNSVFDLWVDDIWFYE